MFSVALLGIAVGTDNWQFIKVNRIAIESNLIQSNINAEEFFDKGLYYTRTKGLFRTCYPEDIPQKEDIYLSAIETRCQTIDYHIFDEDSDISDFSDDEVTRLHMARSVVALFFVGFFFVLVAFCTGVAGCWRRSPANVAATAILMLLSCLFAAGAMGLWHGVEYYEEERIRVAPYKSSWDQMLKDNTQIWYAFSYMLAWVGTGLALLSFCLFLGASQCMQTEQRKEQSKHMQYMMPVYAQKNQYPPNYGYGYPQYGYPQHQYGHYNY